MPPKPRPYWYSRGALRSRAEIVGQKRADEARVDVVIYEVAGGYEARDASAPAPAESHTRLQTLRPVGTIPVTGDTTPPASDTKPAARETIPPKPEPNRARPPLPPPPSLRTHANRDEAPEGSQGTAQA